MSRQTADKKLEYWN